MSFDTNIPISKPMTKSNNTSDVYINNNTLKDVIIESHMAGQMYDGCKHPSFSGAFNYYRKYMEELNEDNN